MLEALINAFPKPSGPEGKISWFCLVPSKHGVAFLSAVVGARKRHCSQGSLSVLLYLDVMSAVCESECSPGLCPHGSCVLSRLVSRFTKVSWFMSECLYFPVHDLCPCLTYTQVYSMGRGCAGFITDGAPAPSIAGICHTSQMPTQYLNKCLQDGS